MSVGKRASVSVTREPDEGSELEVDTSEKKLKYPKAVFFIVCNEFCERFSYYGMRTILSLYLRDKLNYSDDTATVVYHTFSMFVYFFPLFGAMIADSLLGRFRTILYLSIVYAAGGLLISATAAPVLHIPIREFSLLGLLLIAIGSGGIKPCVAAFGGDQFILPQQERYLVMFFSVFYFAINSGSLVSSFLTPELRNGVKCFGESECYSLAFLVPAVLMIISIVVFVLGKPLYRMEKLQGNVVVNVAKCIWCAICNGRSSKENKREHWLDYADKKYDKKIIDDIKAALKVMTLFLPLPIFWALFDQQASRWTFQATNMDGKIGSFILKADQVQVVNPLFIVIFIPIFETCIYPIMSKLRVDTPLKKLTIGGLLAALSFIISGILELQLQATYPVLPSAGMGQVRIFNPQGCLINGHVAGENVTIGPYQMWAKTDIEVANLKQIDYAVNFENCENSTDSVQSGELSVTEKQATSYVLLHENGSPPYSYRDFVNKSGNAIPIVRIIVHDENYASDKPATRLVLSDEKSVKEYKVNSLLFRTGLEEYNPTNYDIRVNDRIVDTYEFKLGGVYTIIVYLRGDEVRVQPIVVSEPNSIHMLWLIPQYVIITMGEVMFSVTGLEFAFTQAPMSMKSLLQAGWLLTVAFGNLIVVIVAEIKFFDKQSSEFFLFAGLMIVDMMIFAVMAKFYKYEVPEDVTNDVADNRRSISLTENRGYANAVLETLDEKL